MADIMRCKKCGFVGFNVQASWHCKSKHPDSDYLEIAECVDNSDADYKRYGFRPSIEYYKSKLRGENVSPWDFEKKRNRF